MYIHIMYNPSDMNSAYMTAFTSYSLCEQGDAAAVRAERCRVTADAIDARRRRLRERCEPVLALHTEQVWRGRAAEASRERLRRMSGQSLHFLESDLAGISASLHAEAERLDGLAASWRYEAQLRAQAEERAAQAERERFVRASDEADRSRQRRLGQSAIPLGCVDS